jgi:hypothetical protein
MVKVPVQEAGRKFINRLRIPLIFMIVGPLNGDAQPTARQCILLCSSWEGGRFFWA